MRKCGSVLVAMVILLFYGFHPSASAQTTYPKTIEKQIKEKLIQLDDNVDLSTEVEVVRLAKVPHKNYYTVLFKFHADTLHYLGEASFKKQDGTFKHTGLLGYAVNTLSESPLEVDNELYYLIYGENVGKQIKTIHVTSFNKELEYSIHPGKEKYYIHYKKIPSNMRPKDMYPVNVTCYGKDNKQIPGSKCVR